MLKITTRRATNGLVFRLEGRLSGPWVEEAQRCFSEEALAIDAEQIEVDLSDVVFIDASGRALLARMHRHGASLRAAGCLTRSIVEQVTSETPRHTTEAHGAKILSNKERTP